MHQEAVREYRRKQRRGVTTTLSSDGFYRPPEGDTCPMCEGAAWSCSTGAHLKTLQHIALKYELSIKELREAIAGFVEEQASGDIVYKALRITADGNHVDSPSSRGYIWTNDVLEAECGSWGDACDEVPGDDCACGFYAFWYLEDAVAYMSHAKDFVVRMKIGGKIEECDDGVRAQYALIEAVLDYASDNDAHETPARGAEILGVPLFEQEV